VCDQLLARLPDDIVSVCMRADTTTAAKLADGVASNAAGYARGDIFAGGGEGATSSSNEQGAVVHYGSVSR